MMLLHNLGCSLLVLKKPMVKPIPPGTVERIMDRRHVILVAVIVFALGLMITLVWLYVSILRMLATIRH